MLIRSSSSLPLLHVFTVIKLYQQQQVIYRLFFAPGFTSQAMLSVVPYLLIGEIIPAA